MVKMKCKKHPSYKGVRKPRSVCATCRAIWNAAEAEHYVNSQVKLFKRRVPMKDVRAAIAKVTAALDTAYLAQELFAREARRVELQSEDTN